MQKALPRGARRQHDGRDDEDGVLDVPWPKTIVGAFVHNIPPVYLITMLFVVYHHAVRQQS